MTDATDEIDDPDETEEPFEDTIDDIYDVMVSTKVAIDNNGRRTRTTIWLATLLVLLAFGTYSCGPHVWCYIDDGTPVTNAFGASWCERDGIDGPTFGDTSLAW